MEDTLRVQFVLQIMKRLLVLILVLMEDTLRVAAIPMLAAGLAAS